MKDGHFYEDLDCLDLAFVTPNWNFMQTTVQINSPLGDLFPFNGLLLLLSGEK